MNVSTEEHTCLFPQFLLGKNLALLLHRLLEKQPQPEPDLDMWSLHEVAPKGCSKGKKKGQGRLDQTCL